MHIFDPYNENQPFQYIGRTNCYHSYSHGLCTVFFSPLHNNREVIFIGGSKKKRYSSDIDYKCAEVLDFTVTTSNWERRKSIELTLTCTMFCTKNIRFVKYFLWPDFTLPCGLAESTSVNKRRGRVFEAHLKHRE